MSAVKIITKAQLAELIRQGKVLGPAPPRLQQPTTQVMFHTLPQSTCTSAPVTQGEGVVASYAAQDSSGSKSTEGTTTESPHCTTVLHEAISASQTVCPAVNTILNGKKTDRTEVEWSVKATKKMLGIYEVRKGSAGFTKNDKKLWATIASEMNEETPRLFSCDVSWEQVKNKFNNIKKGMNAKKDYNRQSGNDPKILTDVEVMLDDILHPMKDGKKTDRPEVAISSPLPVGSLERPQERLVEGSDCDEMEVEEGSQDPKEQSTPRLQLPVSGRFRFQKKKKHGTGSTVAQKKLRLEEQWCSHLKRLEARERRLTEREASLDVHREELIKAKNRKNDLMAKYLSQKELLHKKKEERFRKMLEIEKEKVEVLKSFVESRTSSSKF